METVDPALVQALTTALAQNDGMSWGELLSIALPSVVGVAASVVYAVRATCTHLNSIALRVDETLRHLADGTVTIRVELVHDDVRRTAPPVRAVGSPQARA